MLWNILEHDERFLNIPTDPRIFQNIIEDHGRLLEILEDRGRPKYVLDFSRTK